MTELLDEKQQLSNFRLTRKDGSVVANPPAARMCLLGGLTAIADYRKLQAAGDLTALRPAVEKLGTSSDPGVAREARSALELLAPRK
ncbi:MAG: hypothetical protein K1X57_19785 [Gemmataceae bacterium]|nr:hypothetical protein [Gemmataceae bacterium]